MGASAVTAAMLRADWDMIKIQCCAKILVHFGVGSRVSDPVQDVLVDCRV
jgi:hypothetical protein